MQLDKQQSSSLQKSYSWMSASVKHDSMLPRHPASWGRACEPTMHADVGDLLTYSFPVRASAAEERILTGSLPHRQPFSSPLSSTVDSSARWARTTTRAGYDFLLSFLFLFSRQRSKSRFCSIASIACIHLVGPFIVYLSRITKSTING
jgi:hypothetical protein